MTPDLSNDILCSIHLLLHYIRYFHRDFAELCAPLIEKEDLVYSI